jgi:hypothetical protein
LKNGSKGEFTLENNSYTDTARRDCNWKTDIKKYGPKFTSGIEKFILFTLIRFSYCKKKKRKTHKLVQSTLTEVLHNYIASIIVQR